MTKAKENTALSTIPRFMMEKADKRTGEIKLVPKFKYAEGSPREYRADSKNGSFNIQGITNLGETLEIQPLAWRFFQDEIFGSALKQWAEIFFMDKDNCLACILFHGFSVDNLEALQAPLFYEDITLAEVKLSISWEQHTNDKIKPAAKYHIALFKHEEIEFTDEVEEMHEWASKQRIYRRSSLTKDAFMDGFR